MDSSESATPALPRPRLRPFALAALLGLAVAALLWLSRPGREPANARLLLAVLPIENLSADPGDAYLAEGLTDELIVRLGRVSPDQLGTIARGSAMRFRGATPRDVGRIAGKLGVRYVVLGGVSRRGGGLRLTVELRDAADREPLVSKSYDRETGGLAALPGEVARQLSRRLGIEDSRDGVARLRASQAPDPQAYDLYLRGRHFSNERDEAGLLRSIELFERARARQPGYALAHVALADAYLAQADEGELAPPDALPPARAAAERALELDPELAEAQATLARLRGVFEWDWPRSLSGFERALALDPNDATAHRWYAQVLGALGRPEAALVQIERARELDPLSPIVNTDVAVAFFHAGRLADAEAQYRRTLELDAAWAPALSGLGRSLLRQGRAREALASLERAAMADPGQPEYLATLAWGCGASGRPAEARGWLRELQTRAETRYVSSYAFALAHAAVGQRDAAFAFLEKAYAEQQGGLRWLRVDERLESLRGDPRYADLLRRVGLAS